VDEINDRDNIKPLLLQEMGGEILAFLSFEVSEN
jgi:hypothetical protein